MLEKFGRQTTLAVSTAAIAAFLLMPATADAGALCVEQEGVGLDAGLDCAVWAGDDYDGFVIGVDSPDGVDTKEVLEVVLSYIEGSDVDVTAVASQLEGSSGDFTFDPDSLLSTNSFDWEYTGDLELAFLTVKASTGFVIFDIRGLTEGSIDLSPWHGHDISHVSFWTTGGAGAEIPEPGTLFLLGSGLLAAGGYMRRRQRS